MVTDTTDKAHARRRRAALRYPWPLRAVSGGFPPPNARRWTRGDVLALSAERDAYEARIAQAYAAGVRHTLAWAGLVSYAEDLKQARAAGAAAAARARSPFDAGWQAAMDRFPDAIARRYGAPPPDLAAAQDARWARARQGGQA